MLIRCNTSTSHRPKATVPSRYRKDLTSTSALFALLPRAIGKQYESLTLEKITISHSLAFDQRVLSFAPGKGYESLTLEKTTISHTLAYDHRVLYFAPGKEYPSLTLEMSTTSYTLAHAHKVLYFTPPPGK
jgi:hypothetical protein